MLEKRINLLLTTALLILGGLVACAPQTVEVPVTREVISETTIEVTRVVQEMVTVEVPVELPVEVEVEVTRIVEMVVTATPDSATATVTETVAAADAATPEPTVAPSSSTGNNYTVQTGDNLSLISTKTGADIDAIRTANNLTAGSVLLVGQSLTIPNWDGVIRQTSATAPPAAPANTPTEAQPAAAVGANLLTNPSFEGDWYFANFSELQIPVGWQVATDEGANNLQPGSGGLFNRPEIRVVPSSDLPPNEHGLFIFDGNKTLKAFKGHAPTSFSLFSDVPLEPGRYRFTMNFFADTVDAYAPDKVYSRDAQASEARVIVDNGGTDWQGFVGGQRHTMTHEFTVDTPRTVRVGGSFRNRYAIANNGWFLDDWSLTKVEE